MKTPRKPAPKKPDLSLDPATLRAVADEEEKRGDRLHERAKKHWVTEDGPTLWALARRLRARATRIERETKT